MIIRYCPHPYQALFHKDNSRWRIVVGGRRVGKSKMCLQEAVKQALTHANFMVYWIAPTFKIAKEVGFAEFLTFADDLQPAITVINYSSLEVEFTNGSIIRFRTGDNPDLLRGRKIDLIILDEAAFIKEIIWQVVRPALADTQGKAVLISTPNGIGDWFHTIYNDPLNQWSKYHWTSLMNSDIMTPEEVADLKAGMSQTEYDQEILAKFVTRSGRVYADFDENNVIDSWTYDKSKWDIYLGLDFGFASPTSIAMLAVDKLTQNKVVQFDEIYQARTPINDIMDLNLVRLKTYNIGLADIKCCYSDPAGEAYELSSGESPVDLMRKAGYQVINKKSFIAPGCAQVRSWIRTSNGNRRFFVTKNCKETIRSFNGLQYQEDGKEEPLKDGLHDHLCDAVRYFFVNRFDQAKYVAKDLDQSSYGKETVIRSTKRCPKCNKLFRSDTGLNRPPFVCTNCKD